jgi:protein-S-isoprenylcysteine O-methyltransferase Ste14
MTVKTTDTLRALIGTLFFLLVLVPFFLILIPHQILSSPAQIHPFDIGEIRYLGIVPIALGVVIYVWCACSFVFIGIGTPIPFTPTRKLVVTGLYRFVRNPLYIAGALVLAGEAILFQSLGILIYSLVMFAIFNVHVFIEEAELADRFGSTYERYHKSVPRWMPRLKPYDDNDCESL